MIEQSLPIEALTGISCIAQMQFPRNVQVQALGVNHSELGFNIASQDIEAAIKGSNVVSVESDESHITKGESGGTTSFYDHIFELASKHHKPVLCCDPLRETEIFALVDVGLGIGGLTMSTYSGLSVTGAIAINKKVTRKEFLNLATFGVAAFILLGTDLADVPRDGITGCNGSTIHPKPTDLVSYNNFRNSAFILGISQLINLGIVHDTLISHFIGSMHTNDYNGFADHGVVDLESVKTVYNHNLYQFLAQSLRLTNNIRIWVPHLDDFKLREIPFSISQA